MKRCYLEAIIMMSLHARRFVVMHLYSTFCGPPEFSFRSKFIPKLQFFVILGAVSPHFLNDNGEIWHESVDL